MIAAVTLALTLTAAFALLVFTELSSPRHPLLRTIPLGWRMAIDSAAFTLAIFAFAHLTPDSGLAHAAWIALMLAIVGAAAFAAAHVIHRRRR